MFTRMSGTALSRYRCGAATLMLAAGLVGAGAATAHAQVPPVVQRMERALAAVHSFQVVMDSTGGVSVGSKATLSTHIELTVVRHGKTASMYMMIASKKASGEIAHQAMAYTGSRFCERASATAAWQCTAPDPQLVSQVTSLSPDNLFSAVGVHLQPAPLARKVVHGQASQGYAMTTEDMSSSDKNTLWVADATNLPVEDDILMTLNLGKTAQVLRTTAVYGRWNDAGLTIPAIPGS